jgi:hypothetical protein
MNLIEGFLKDSLFIDFGSEIIYGSDQMDISRPVRFATVGFQLMSTAGLDQIVDRIRKDAGFVPLHPMDEYTDENCDMDAWYDFYIGINDLPDCRVDTCIEAVVVNAFSPDNEETYTIDLDGNEQAYVYARLDEQCRQYLGKSCEDLIREAKAEMEGDQCHTTQ